MMKSRNVGSVWRRWAAGGLVAGAALFLATGCEQKPPGGASAPAVSPQGEPIRGEPIVAPAPPPEVAAVKATAAPATTEQTNAPAAAAVPSATGASSVTSAPPTLASAVTPPDATNGTPPAMGKGTVENPTILAFEKLASFQYALPDGPVDTNTVVQAGSTNQIPDVIRSLNNQFVTLKGFMLPLKVEKGLVTELLIMRDQSMCCYGTVPKINEWVSVKMVGTGVKPIMDQAVTLFGKFKVGEMYENGYLVGIYAMDGEKMAGPLDM